MSEPMVTVEHAAPRGNRYDAVRWAGRGALLAGIAFLVQPMSVGFLAGGSYAEDMRDPLRVDTWWWVGVVQGVEFLAVAVGVLLLVTALRRSWPDGLLNDVAAAAGWISAVSFLALGALQFVSHSWWAMPDTAVYSDDPEVRGAIAAALGYVGLALVATACLATALWSVGVVRLSSATGDIGRWTAVTVALVAVVILLGTLAQMAIPFAVLHVVLWLVLGVRLSRTRSLPPPVRRGPSSAA